MKLKNDALQDLYDTFLYGPVLSSKYAESPIDEAFRECDEKLSESVTFALIKDLKESNNILRKSELNLLETNMEAISERRKLEKELDGAKKQLERLTQLRDIWWDRAKHAEDEVEDLKKDYDELTKNYQDLSIKLKRCQINKKPKTEEVPFRSLESWECTLEGTIETNKDILNKILRRIYLDQEFRQNECFTEMCADMTVVDYPERFRNKKDNRYYRWDVLLK